MASSTLSIHPDGEHDEKVAYDEKGADSYDIVAVIEADAPPAKALQ